MQKYSHSRKFLLLDDVSLFSGNLNEVWMKLVHNIYLCLPLVYSKNQDPTSVRSVHTELTEIDIKCSGL